MSCLPVERSLSAFSSGIAAARVGQSALRTTAFRPASSSRTRAVRTMATLEVYVKGDPKTNTLLDCPFCQRVLLTLEEKKIPYQKEMIDFANKPEWLQEKSGGKVPLIHSGDLWLPDSDEIIKYLEEQYPQPSMASDVPPDVTGSFFGAFRGYLTAPAAEAEAKKPAFLEELKKIDAYLASHKGPFFGGDHLNATDAAFAPKLYHAVVALGHYKGWALDAGQYPALAAYWSKLQALPEWKATDYGKEAIVKGWAKAIPAQ